MISLTFTMIPGFRRTGFGRYHLPRLMYCSRINIQTSEKPEKNTWLCHWESWSQDPRSRQWNHGNVTNQWGWSKRPQIHPRSGRSWCSYTPNLKHVGTPQPWGCFMTSTPQLMSSIDRHSPWFFLCWLVFIPIFFSAPTNPLPKRVFLGIFLLLSRKKFEVAHLHL